ncbi:hypothetical protein HK098_003278 [Nowakowskiella sp. JEL0407]|nr:hypothetical protein HK098_003278 [Nowakowskiella sp. JEL0407]
MSKIEDLREFKISKDEADSLASALKNSEFRKLLGEYMEEISNPENRALYESELKALELERGNNVIFINPNPGAVLKTYFVKYSNTPSSKSVASDGGDGKKVFINLCTAPQIEVATTKNAKKADGKIGKAWSLPYSLSSPKEDVDNAKNPCTVYDCVVHPDTFKMAQSNIQFADMLSLTAIEGIEKQFNVTLDRKYKTLKMKQKSKLSTTIIRRPATDSSSSPPNKPGVEDFINSIKESTKASTDLTKVTATGKSAAVLQTPKYKLVEQGEVDIADFTDAAKRIPSARRPAALVIKIELPLVETASEVELDTNDTSIALLVPQKYKLDLTLPYPVLVDDGKAKFDKSKKELNLWLPVVPQKKQPLIQEISPMTETQKEDDLEIEAATNEQLETDSDEKVTEIDVVPESTSETPENQVAPFTHRQSRTTVKLSVIVPSVSSVSIESTSDDIVSFRFENTSYVLNLKFVEPARVEDIKTVIGKRSVTVYISKKLSETSVMWESIGVCLSNGTVLQKPFLKTDIVDSDDDLVELESGENESEENGKLPEVEAKKNENVDNTPGSLPIPVPVPLPILKSPNHSPKSNSLPKHVHFNKEVEVAQIADPPVKRKGKRGNSGQNGVAVVKKGQILLEGEDDGEENDDEIAEKSEDDVTGSNSEYDSEDKGESVDEAEQGNECPRARKVKKKNVGQKSKKGKKNATGKGGKDSMLKSDKLVADDIQLSNGLIFELD